MASLESSIRAFDLRAASDEEYALLNGLEDRLRAERLPDDPPVSLDERVANWRNIPSFVDASAWLIPGADGTTAIGVALFVVPRTEENRHAAQLELGVDPAFRRQGLARRLLAPVLDEARREGRRLLIASTNARVPAGEAFMRRLGAVAGQHSHTNQLAVAELDRELLARWLAEGPTRAAGFELGLWEAEYPEEELAAVAELHELLNQMPRDDLEIEDFHYTPEQLRQMERAHHARGTRRWTIYARERATGAFAGFTEVTWHPNRPAILDQGITGVFPAHRNLGLGRWLKAAMLDKVLRERLEVRFICTSNADTNAAMLRINRALGFRPYLAETMWQLGTDAARRYLGETA